MEQTDSDLVEATLQGDLEAFRTLYERYWRMAVGVALTVCSDRDLAEDAAQEAFALAARQLAALRETKRFPQWLRTICRRKASLLRQRQPPFVALQIDPPDSSFDDSASRASMLSNAMHRLSDEAREILVLRYFSQLPHEEIAKILETTPAAVHGRLQRARRKLESLLKTEFSNGDAHVPK